MRYLKVYRESENELEEHGIEGLISKSGKGYTGRKDNKVIEICHPYKKDVVLDTVVTRLPEEYIPVIKDVIENEYLHKRRMSKMAVFESIQIKCYKEGLEPLRYSTISSLIGRISEKTKESIRSPKKAAEKFDDVARGYANEEALHPLDIVQIDHTQFDFLESLEVN
jgi:putative transposase